MKLTLNDTERDLIGHALSMVKLSKESEPIAAGLMKRLYPSPKPKKELKEKRYSFNFSGGGWNTVWAKTKPGAYKQACKEYGLGVVSNTVRLCDSKRYDSLIMMSS